MKKYLPASFYKFRSNLPKKLPRQLQKEPISRSEPIDQRWSASSEKMSSLTVRILSVNIIAIMILGAGILYLGEYTDSLIEAELESMRTEARFVSGALSEGAVRPVFQISPLSFEDPIEIEALKPNLARRMVRRLGESGTSRVLLYNVEGSLLADTQELANRRGNIQVEKLNPQTPLQKNPMSIGALFDQSATRFLDLIPTQTHLGKFPARHVGDISVFPDSRSAMLGSISASAWRSNDGGIILTAAAPIQKIKQVLGITLLVRDGSELEKKIADIRVDVFRVFLGSLGITVMLSIYLSGLIGRPLKKLAQSAEAVRLGKSREIEIPDMSKRGDEIGELSLVLKEMTEALWNRMDTIENFAADVAHEIKNPLTSLRSAVETAARVKDDKSRKKLMDIIHHDVQRLDRLISDISNASRLDAELSREEMEKVDLHKLLLRLQDAYKKPLERTKRGKNAKQDGDGKIILHVPDQKNLFVSGRPERLEQVFGNLISNALSFSPAEGQVVISVRAHPMSEQKLQVLVEDSGPGIPDNKIDTIFERFYTERPDHEDYGAHSGLGLSISKQIVEALGGRIWAENILDKNNEPSGARFIVELKTA
ncbi:MAG: sensor histidine kinase [Alphaproteobacteria bacterium]|nr:sensor histidine kinase [Alphaproteobacteria bacterium]